MDDPDLWRWIWLMAAGGFAVGEMAAPGSFFLLPFAVGALIAFVLSLIGLPTAISFVVFLITSTAAFLALRPLAKRMDEQATPVGMGATRLSGSVGVVTTAIGEGSSSAGSIQVERETWRAESADGSPIPAGTEVQVIELKGTRAVVWPTQWAQPRLIDRPPTSPPHE